MNQFTLAGRGALVIGGTKGIGLAIVRAAAAGARLDGRDLRCVPQQAAAAAETLWGALRLLGSTGWTHSRDLRRHSCTMLHYGLVMDMPACSNAVKCGDTSACTDRPMPT